MNNYDIIIIGAGPGGIFSAYELSDKNTNLKIAVFEAGHELIKRKCPIDGERIKSCVNCKSCSIMSGFGGAGAFSDGKYNITNSFGGTLHEHIGKKQALELMKYVDRINTENGGDGTKLYSTAGTKFKKICIQNKLELLDASVRHLGTDINFKVLENLYGKLKSKIDFYFDSPVSTVKFESGMITVIKKGELFEMDFPSYSLTRRAVTPEICEALGTVPSEVYKGRDLLCILKDEETVMNLKPDLNKVKELDGLLLQVSAKGKNYDCVSRTFAPKMNISEDPVCGSGHCHIIPYWSERLKKEEITAYQASERGGVLYCKAEKDRIKIGGKAVLFSVSELFTDEYI